MKSEIRNIALCALLGVTMSANAVTVSVIRSNLARIHECLQSSIGWRSLPVW